MDWKLNQTRGHDASVVPPEAEGVVHDNVCFLLSGFLRDVVQITLWIRIFQIDGGGKEIGFEGLETDGHFDRAGGTEKVA